MATATGAGRGSKARFPSPVDRCDNTILLPQRIPHAAFDLPPRAGSHSDSRPPLVQLPALTMSRFSPPPSFSLVHPQLYRSATFHTPHFDFLSSLRLATLVSLGEDMPSTSASLAPASSFVYVLVLIFSQAGHFKHGASTNTSASCVSPLQLIEPPHNSPPSRQVHLGNRTPTTLVLSAAPFRSWKPVSDELVKDALEFILDRAQQPCLIMDQYVSRKVPRGVNFPLLGTEEWILVWSQVGDIRDGDRRWVLAKVGGMDAQRDSCGGELLRSRLSLSGFRLNKRAFGLLSSFSMPA